MLSRRSCRSDVRPDCAHPSAHANSTASTASVRLYYVNTDVSVLSPSSSCTSLRDRYMEELSTPQTWERVRVSSCFTLRGKKSLTGASCTPFLLPAVVDASTDKGDRTKPPAYKTASDLHFACNLVSSGSCSATVRIAGGREVVFTKEVS